MVPSSPKTCLLTGVEILNPAFQAHGFVFAFGDEVQGSGGVAAWGEFVRGDRRLELHFRESLGMVTYHLKDKIASHEAYMRELGVWGQNRYPGLSSEYLQAFRDLEHDLGFAGDFLSGDGAILLLAALKEATACAGQSERFMAHAVGDVRNLEKMRELFKQKRYAEVVALFNDLKYPDLLSEAQLRVVRLARERTGS